MGFREDVAKNISRLESKMENKLREVTEDINRIEVKSDDKMQKMDRRLDKLENEMRRYQFGRMKSTTLIHSDISQSQPGGQAALPPRIMRPKTNQRVNEKENEDEIDWFERTGAFKSTWARSLDKELEGLDNSKDTTEELNDDLGRKQEEMRELEEVRKRKMKRDKEVRMNKEKEKEKLAEKVRKEKERNAAKRSEERKQKENSVSKDTAFGLEVNSSTSESDSTEDDFNTIDRKTKKKEEKKKSTNEEKMDQNRNHEESKFNCWTRPYYSR